MAHLSPPLCVCVCIFVCTRQIIFSPTFVLQQKKEKDLKLFYHWAKYAVACFIARNDVSIRLLSVKHTQTHTYTCIMRKRCVLHKAIPSCQTHGPPLLPSPLLPLPHLFPKLGKGPFTEQYLGHSKLVSSHEHVKD